MTAALVALSWWSGHDGYDPGTCRYLGGSVAIAEPVAFTPGAATPDAAIAAFVADPASTATVDPLPADGWVEHWGSWVHDRPDGAFTRLDLERTGFGWRVTSASICGHG